MWLKHVFERGLGVWDLFNLCHEGPQYIYIYIYINTRSEASRNPRKKYGHDYHHRLHYKIQIYLEGHLIAPNPYWLPLRLLKACRIPSLNHHFGVTSWDIFICHACWLCLVLLFMPAFAFSLTAVLVVNTKNPWINPYSHIQWHPWRWYVFGAIHSPFSFLKQPSHLQILSRSRSPVTHHIVPDVVLSWGDVGREKNPWHLGRKVILFNQLVKAHVLMVLYQVIRKEQQDEGKKSNTDLSKF